jgi:hypothetical protein
VARDRPGQERVDREHEGGEQRDEGIRREDARPGLEDDEDAHEPDSDGRPSPPSDLLAEDRSRKRGHEQRIGDEDRVGLDKADEREGQNHHADLGRKQNAAQDLDPRFPRGCRGPQAARLPGGKRHDEGREEPEADHHDHEHVVAFGQMAREHVLDPEDQRRRDHVEDAEAEVLFGHGRNATVMCRLRP